MEVVEHKVPVRELTVGMYVSKLDRPWLETPFKIQGFLVTSQTEIEEIESVCDYVYVDVVKSRAKLKSTQLDSGIYSSDGKSPVAKYPFTPVEIKHGTYREITAFENSSGFAYQANEAVDKALVQVTSQISKGLMFDQKSVKNVASNIVSSVIQNPDVLACLTRVREADDYLHHHSIRCSVWGAILGRHIGLRRMELEILTQAILLKDLGKTRLPQDVLNLQENEMNSEKRVIYKKHVAMTVKLAQQISGLHPKILPIIASHCERYDGSGYPRQQRGDEIPQLAIIAGIATYYDELTNPRDIKKSKSPSATLATLYDQRNSLFQEDLVLEFIQALGLYPAGSVVELNTGQLAVVVEQYAERRLRPRVVIVTDENQVPVSELTSLDLLSEAISPQEKEMLEQGNKKTKLPFIYIVKDLQVSEFAVDLLKVKEKLFTPNKKRFGFFNFRT
jgi:HD-GYP domain-containing protein (c-di-GMP phosphodiesterase class II)